jgi:hypothetical protein
MRNEPLVSVKTDLSPAWPPAWPRTGDDTPTPAFACRKTNRPAYRHSSYPFGACSRGCREGTRAAAVVTHTPATKHITNVRAISTRRACLNRRLQLMLIDRLRQFRQQSRRSFANPSPLRFRHRISIGSAADAPDVRTRLLEYRSGAFLPGIMTPTHLM